ncbi:YcbK family protein [Aurantimonas coralicida]|uniref:YcbK family protein n=1 Tax=Aurantimonas coralicida TaxID=182270 RepID=UPI001E4DCE83|nr:D-Ala-D-Ala carboxypeptidase family metallohydrolase [Aurantimonas coralicida]MCD1644813.1 DUF882 domain-containing protein [Aurantimonas coralicida]
MGPRLDKLSPRIGSAYQQFLELYPTVPVTSAYRDPDYNAKVGGAKGSAHVHGDAMDFSVRGLDEAQKAEVVDWWRQQGATGLGYYPKSDSIHVDMREGPNRAWGPNYSHTSLDQTPGWFRSIASEHRGAPSGGGSYTKPLQTGPSTMVGYPSNGVGGLGGLGGYQEPQREEPGFFQSDKFGNVLQAVGLSLMSAPRNAPLSHVGDYLPGIQQQTMKKNLLEQERAEENKTFGYLRQNFPDIAAQVDAGLPVSDAFRMVSDERRRAAEGPKLTQDERNYLRAQSDPAYSEFLQNSGGGQYGLSVIPGVDAEGNPILLQPGRDGTAVQTQLPDGVRPLGPHDLNQQRSMGTEVGKGQGQAITSAPSQISSADQSLGLIDDILDDPNLGNVTGWQGQLPTFQSQNIDVEAKVDQLKGRAFAEAIQQMVGLGALSDAEGKAILQGAARLDYRQSDAGFKRSLGDLRSSIEKARERAAAILSGNASPLGGDGAGRQPPSGGGNRTSNGLSWSVN